MSRNRALLFPLYMVCTISLAAMVLLVMDYHNAENRLKSEAQTQAKLRADEAVTDIESQFSRLKGIVDDVVDRLEQMPLAEADLRELLDSHIDGNPSLGLKQLGVAYKPYAYDAARKLHAPAYNVDNGTRSYIGSTYDYTEPLPDNNWYHVPLKKGAIWHEPYFGKDAQDWLAEYGAAFSGANAKTGVQEDIGVMYANLSLAKVRELVGALDLGASGYGFILTSKGTIVSHPLRDYLGKRIACEPGAKQSECLTGNDEFITQSMDMVRAGQVGDYRSVRNPRTGQLAWVYLKPIEPTSWSIAIVLNEGDFLGDVAKLRQDRLLLLTSGLVFLISLTLILLRVDQGNRKRLIAASALVSLYSFSAIVLVWLISISVSGDSDYVVPATTLHDAKAGTKRELSGPNVKVYDQAGAESVLSACIGSQQAIEVVPTGVFIQSINFTSANNVTMTGYVWQKLSSEQAAANEVNIVLPEAESVSMEEAYREELLEEGKHLVGWYFVATLRQQFGYQKYPFDREDVWLRIWSQDLNRGTVLVPDFSSYDLIAPETMPGLEENFVLEGWKLENSFFSYRATPYNTRFGFADHGAKNACPELYFNVGIKRKFISPFISDILPIFIITVLVFAVLLISTKNDAKMGLFGFSTSAVLGYCAALFFVLIVSHVHLRESLAAHGVIYLEYFYFVTYAVILAASANSVIFASDRYVHLIHYKDNFYVKLAYWPVVLLALLATTIPNFY